MQRTLGKMLLEVLVGCIVGLLILAGIAVMLGPNLMSSIRRLPKLRRPVNVAAGSRPGGAVARAQRRRGATDQQRTGGPLCAADLTAQSAGAQCRGDLAAAPEGADERVAHRGPGPLRAARAAALQATLDEVAAQDLRLHLRRKLNL